jgi:hypothetical protein
VSKRRNKSLHLTGPLILWLALQLIVLSVAAAGIPLASNSPQPPEHLAADEMLVGQFVFVTMLFPYLLRSVWSGLAVILTSLPMLEIAGFLSTSALDRLALAAAFFTMWVIALTLFRLVLTARASCLTAVAIANAYVLGGAILWYVQHDFRPESARGFASLTPLPAVLTLLHADKTGLKPWLTVLLPLACAVAAVLVSAARRPAESPVETHADVT